MPIQLTIVEPSGKVRRIDRAFFLRSDRDDYRLQAGSLALFASLLLPPSVLAQVGQAELRGAVLDESGAALPGATMTATHVDTGTVRTTVTSATGTYVMPALPIGVYKILPS